MNAQDYLYETLTGGGYVCSAGYNDTWPGAKEKRTNIPGDVQKIGDEQMVKFKFTIKLGSICGS